MDIQMVLSACKINREQTILMSSMNMIANNLDDFLMETGYSCQECRSYWLI